MNVGAFYHVAAMNDWRRVVSAQLGRYARAGIPALLQCSINGTAVDQRWLEDVAGKLGVALSVETRSCEMQAFERPAFRLLQRWVLDEGRKDDDAVLYWHTKGVGAPGDEHKRRWRELMERHVIDDWRECVSALGTHDVVGVNWREMRPISHFQGNFWWATVKWLRRLSGFDWYYDSPWYNTGWDAHGKRLGCEFWVSSCNAVPVVKSLVCRDVDFCNSAYLEGLDL
jgi:hypothetical protein